MEFLSNKFKSEVFEPYRDFLKSEFRFHPKFSHAKQIWEEKLTFEELVHGAFLEKSQNYAAGSSLDEIALHEKTKRTIQKRLDNNPLYQHQTEAVNLILQNKNAVIATGTSSGKTLCYQIPILDDLLKNQSEGLRAIIIYPLNALVNDQLEEWQRMLAEHQQITFARFTGQTPNNQIDYENRLKAVFSRNLKEENATFTESQLQRAVQSKLRDEIDDLPKNRLNHRETIRDNPPHVLVTNFSMLEYLLERPIDAPIFENAQLKYLVLDEVHAYRGVQATEIAFLVRRLKDRLGLEKLTCIATSATLGEKDNPSSEAKVRKFVSDLFDENFDEPNPIYGTPKTPQLKQPSFSPTPLRYVEAVKDLRENPKVDLSKILYGVSSDNLAETLRHDESLFRLRKDILTKPILLKDAADALFPNDENNENALQALLEIVASAKTNDANEDLLPTRLHYFVRAEDGLHVCLHKNCPARISETEPAFFVSRRHENTPEGLCPRCFPKYRSNLVEVVTCRKCGYLFGALQDLGPRRARDETNDNDKTKPQFDSFDTELGWASDSFWSYISVENDLPFPKQKFDEDEDDEDTGKLLDNPAELDFCVQCNKKHDKGSGDNCICEKPHLRKIKVFHRQCPEGKLENLYNLAKKPLTACPNCAARNASGLEPVRRFQESEDETGLAMAIPLSHFQLSDKSVSEKPPRKLLCFTDHRQRAAAFPSLLEENTFTHDLGRKIVEIVRENKQPLEFTELAEQLADVADISSDNYDADFFLPISRFPDDDIDYKEKRKLWTAEVFSYFGIPDSARESAEDLGLTAVEFRLEKAEKAKFQSIFPQFSEETTTAILQTFLQFIRQRKAFTLPKGVAPDALAFGRLKFEKFFALRRERQQSTQGWLPKINKDGGFRHNMVTDYLRFLLNSSDAETLGKGEEVWNFLTDNFILLDKKKGFQLDHERLTVGEAKNRFVCERCSFITAYSANSIDII